jgi:hypothetical protein
MKKKLFFAGVVLGLMIVFVGSGTWALDNGPDKITINAQDEYSAIITKKDKKKVENFPHRMHQEKFLTGNEQYSNFKYSDDYTCAGCHHTTKPGEQPISCLKCKDVNKMLAKVGGADKFEKIYHENCRDKCHKNMAKAGKKSGPTKCKDCHGKNSD